MSDGQATAALEQRVVGQARAREALTRLIDMHQAWFTDQNMLHRAPNAIVIGPTGTGKTHAIKVVAEALDIPLVVVDSTRLVATGANDHLTLEGVLVQLVKRARTHNRTMKEPERLAEQGIVFLDEFDKLRFAQPSDDTAAIQRRLLQFIEGDTLDLEPGEDRKQRTISTHGILFIAAGAFSGIEKTKSQRSPQSSRAPGTLHTIQAVDVRNYGFLHELVARLPIIIRFHPLGKQELRRILEHPVVSPLDFYTSYFRRRGFEVVVTSETLDLVAEAAARLELGARGLHQELFPVLSALAEEFVDLSGQSEDKSAPIELELTPGRYRELQSRVFRAGKYEVDAR